MFAKLYCSPMLKQTKMVFSSAMSTLKPFGLAQLTLQGLEFDGVKLADTVTLNWTKFARDLTHPSWRVHLTYIYI